MVIHLEFLGNKTSTISCDTAIPQTAYPASKQGANPPKTIASSRNAVRKICRARLPFPGGFLHYVPQSSLIPQDAHPLKPRKNQVFAADVGKLGSGLEGSDHGPPDDVAAFAAPVIGTEAPDVVEHDGFALVRPYI